MTDSNRRFYDEEVAPMILRCFPDYADRIANLKDRVVGLSEDIGYDISQMLKSAGLITRINPYLEADVTTVMNTI